MVGGGGQGSASITKVDIYEGTQGLEMEFMKNAPPDDVIEGHNFKVGVDLSNEGAQDILDGYITVSLEDQYMKPVEGETWEVSSADIFTGSSSDPSMKFNLMGKSIESPHGERVGLFYNVNAKHIDRQTETHRSNILVTGCYRYKTHARPLVCLDPDMYDRVQDVEKSCEMQPASMSDQGAPVAVTEVIPKMLPADEKLDDVIMFRPAFQIRIQNVGDGEVFNPDKIQQACSAKAITYGDFNTYYIDVRLNGVSLKCNPTPPFRLTYERDNILCEVVNPDQFIPQNILAFETLLEIELTYGYTKTISSEVLIRRDPAVVVY